MKFIVALILSLSLFSITAMASDSPTGESDSYEYQCKIKAFVFQTKNFRYKHEAQKFCSKFDDQCDIFEESRRNFVAIRKILVDVDYFSNESWAHARSNALLAFNTLITDHDYFYDDFSYQFSFNKCFLLEKPPY